MNKLGITAKISIVVLTIVLVSIGLVTLISYQTSYEQVKKAAGIELIGCANITTGLVASEDIYALLKGDQSRLEQVEKQISWTIAQKPIFQNQYVISLDGTLLAVDESMKKQGFHAGDRFYLDQQAVDMIKQMKHPDYTDTYEFANLTRITGYAPIFLHNDPAQEIIALNAIDFDASIVAERTWEMVKFTIIAGCILPVAAALVTFILVKKHIKPLSRINHHLNCVTNGDFTLPPLEVNSNDEIGQLSQNFNRMVSSLSNLVKQLMQVSTRLVESGTDVNRVAHQTGIAAHEIAAAIAEVAGGANRQAERASTVLDYLEKAKTQIHRGDEKAQTIVQTAMHSTEEARRGEIAINEAIAHLGDVTETVQFATDSIQRLGNRSDEIGGIITAISQISSQTNLLALNAAIEAARAGEQGKGFAVVANEVRVLAEQSNQAAQQITGLISSIQKETTETVETMEGNLASVKRQLDIIREGGDSLSVIVKQVELTESNVKELQTSLSQVDTMMQGIVSETGGIVEIIERTKASSEEVSTFAKEQSATVEQLAQRAGQLEEMAGTLDKELSKFNV
ncbi:MAG: methyl-accepting chemotaxis protein [Clostridia bacterium]